VCGCVCVWGGGRWRGQGQGQGQTGERPCVRLLQVVSPQFALKHAEVHGTPSNTAHISAQQWWSSMPGEACRNRMGPGREAATHPVATHPPQQSLCLRLRCACASCPHAAVSAAVNKYIINKYRICAYEQLSAPPQCCGDKCWVCCMLSGHTPLCWFARA